METLTPTYSAAGIGTQTTAGGPQSTAESERIRQIKAALDQRHPSYDQDELTLYRLTYEGGSPFIKKYLKKHFEENAAGWSDRSSITYNPEFASEAVDEYVRAIAQRAVDINRVGGNKKYHALTRGELGGIDRNKSSLDALFGKYVIPELLAMGRVGVYIDNDITPPNVVTLADAPDTYPYIYTYRAEDILNWHYNSSKQLDNVLLRVYSDKLNAFGLPGEITTQYRHIYQYNKDQVVIDTYSDTGVLMSTIVQTSAFPFVLLTIPKSLLKKTARHQIALLNLASSDLYYAWAANFPIYTEQHSPMDFARFQEQRTLDDDLPPTKDDPTTQPSTTRKTGPGANSRANTIRVGTMSGRSYPQNSERPGFIHPSSEPLTGSMAKEDQIKQEIRQLTALAVTSLSPTSNVSAEAKSMDNLGLEAGMTYIGKILEAAENQISAIWHSYIRSESGKTPTIATYPHKYSLKSDAERQAEATSYKDLLQAVPSVTYQKTIAKKIVRVLLSAEVTQSTLDTISKEIDSSPVPTSDPDTLRSDHEAGLVSTKTASVGRGYAPDEAAKAAEDHAARLLRVAEANAAGAILSAAAKQSTDGGGVDTNKVGDPDQNTDPNAVKDDRKNNSQNPDNNAEASKNLRGDGKKVAKS